MLFTKKRLPLAAAITTVMAAGPVAAQQLEEVIVTAQKRAENLQDVPISVSTLSGERIQDNTVLNFAALADFVPSLHIAEASVNTNIYMRGIGSGNNRGFEQSVGMYLDGVYLGRGRQYRSALLDVERVEVLRGPQGTLFGKNTVAGAINITSASPVPGDEASGEINASVEENGGQIYEGYIQGGGETFAARLALRYRETDGYVYNAYLDQDEGGYEETGGRLTLVWQPNDDFSANLKYSNMQRDRIGSNSASWLYLNPAERDQLVPNRSPVASAAYAVMDVFYPDFPSVAGQDYTTYKDNNCGPNGVTNGCSEAAIGKRPDSSDDELQNFSLNMNWEVGNGTLTSVTGWAGYEYFDDVDVDWLPLQFIDRSDIHDFDQFSQEIRWASDIGDRFTYTVGGYYDDNELDMQGQVVIDTNFAGLFAPVAAVAFGFPAQNLWQLLSGGAYSSNQISRNHSFNQKTESWALFAQGTYDLTEALRVTVGLRYTEEEKDARSYQLLGDENCPTADKATSLAGLCTGGIPVAPGVELGYNPFLAVYQAALFNTYNKDWQGSRKTDDLSPSVNVQWDVGDSSMLYISWSQGFKSGGFSAADDGEPGDFSVSQIPPTFGNSPGGAFISTVPNADFEFDDESVDAIEIGGKHEFLDGAMRLNWAAFYSEYDDLQTTIFKGVGFSVKNAASSEVQGIEVDWMMQVTDALRVGVNAAYLDAEYGDFPDGPCTAIQLDANSLCGTPAGIAQGSQNDLTGYRTLYASEWSGNAFADFRMPLMGMELFAGVDVNYRSEFDSAGDADPVDVIDAYTKVNARIGLSGNNWEVMAYGRNIFDEVAYQQSFDTPTLAGSHTWFMEEGQVFGVRGTLRF